MEYEQSWRDSQAPLQPENNWHLTVLRQKNALLFYTFSKIYWSQRERQYWPLQATDSRLFGSVLIICVIIGSSRRLCKKIYSAWYDHFIDSNFRWQNHTKKWIWQLTILVMWYNAIRRYRPVVSVNREATGLCWKTWTGEAVGHQYLGRHLWASVECS